MTQLEGIIKYDLQYTPSGPLQESAVKEIGFWRQKMVEAKMIGQDPQRYGGYGFGNISCRLSAMNARSPSRRFVITGSQTGHKKVLTAMDYSIVDNWDVSRNRIVASGPVRPSSESLTHAVLYGLSQNIRWVIHVHFPDLWCNADGLKIPLTRREVAYGTVDMAREVERLFAETPVAKRRIFAMGGHEDGLVAFGQTAMEAAGAIMNLMAIRSIGRGGGI